MIIRLRSRSCGHWIISRPWRINWLDRERTSIVSLARLEESDGRFDEICDLMEILIEDWVDDPCLNFSIHHPIFDIEIKDEMREGDILDRWI